MAVSRKTRSKKAVPQAVASFPAHATVKKIAQVFFRAPANLIETVERVAKARPIPATRQTWLLEAILEKLERETGKGVKWKE